VHGQLTVDPAPGKGWMVKSRQRFAEAKRSGAQTLAAVTVDGILPVYHLKPDSTMSFLVKHLTFFVTPKSGDFGEQQTFRQPISAITDQGLGAEVGGGHSHPVFENAAEMFNMFQPNFFRY